MTLDSPSPSSKTPPSSERLIAVARHELATAGLRAMSYRRLGEAAGTTSGALTYHLGPKLQILADVVAGERERDRTWHAAWLERLTPLKRLDAEALAVLLEHYLEAISRDEARLTQLIWADLMLRAPRDEDIQALMRPWRQERRDFWRRLFEGRVEDASMWSRAAWAFTTDEGVHSLAVGDDPDYRLLRRMAVDRLSRRLDPAQRGAVIGAFADLVARLDPRLDLPGRDADSDLLTPGRRHDIALSACGVLLDEGVDGVTHRAVGERVGRPPSTVAYHFRGTSDLVRAGLAMVYLVAQARALAPAPDSPERRRDVVVCGTLAVALAAARDPSLVPYALDLRRLRGENYVHTLRDAGCIHIDDLDGQVCALAAIGAAALAGLGEDIDFEALNAWLLQSLRN